MGGRSVRGGGLGVIVERDVPMRARDGVTLYADVYRPDADGRFPVLVVRTPYDKSQRFAPNGNPAVHVSETHFFPQRGYVVVAQDTRGRFRSEGEFSPFVTEAADGYDTVEWAARLPWSDGNVAMTGQSYQGLVQYLAAPERPPHLRAMSPVSGPVTLFENCFWRRGVLELGWLLAYVIGLSRETLARKGLLEAYEAVLDGYLEDPAVRFSPLWLEEYAHLPIRDWSERLADGAPYLRDLLEHWTDGPFWQSLDMRRRVHEIDVPMLHVGSWYDAFQPDPLAMFAGLRERAMTREAREAQRLIMGPWPHIPYSIPTSSCGEADFGPEALIELHEIQLRWFDYWLKGVATGIVDEPPVRLFVMGDNRWRDESEWPLARTRYTPVYLHSDGRANTLDGDGRLSFAPPAEEPPDRYTYDPRDPVPTRGGTTLVALGLAGGAFDQRDVERREDVLVYTGDTLTEDVEVTGPVSLTLFAASSAFDTDFTAKLVDVRPDGYAQNVVDGVIRTRFRESLEAPTLVEPGVVTKYTVDLWSTSHVFKAGHRLRLEVSSSNFPRYDRNPNTGHDFGVDAELRSAQQTVFHDGRYPSCLVLPVIPR